MTDIDLTQKLLKFVNDDDHIRKIGRYSISNIWAMLNNYLKPEDYLKPEIKDFPSAFNIWQGKNKHLQVQQLLKDDYLLEVKEEFKVHDFVVVGQVDAINKDEILEIKTSQEIHQKSKSWHDYQALLYCTFFKRPECRIVQPVFTPTKLLLKVIGIIKRDDAKVEKEMEKLLKYHQKVIKFGFY